jgi:hypothetical protein
MTKQEAIQGGMDCEQIQTNNLRPPVTARTVAGVLRRLRAGVAG